MQLALFLWPFKMSVLYTVVFLDKAVFFYMASWSRVCIGMAVLAVLKNVVHHTFSSCQSCLDFLVHPSQMLHISLVCHSLLCPRSCHSLLSATCFAARRMSTSISTTKGWWLQRRVGKKEWVNEWLRRKRHFSTWLCYWRKHMEWHPQMEKIFLICPPDDYHPAHIHNMRQHSYTNM